ncbi:MAG: FAD-binding protein [Granulosicoccus sp.]|nr:FAD-binding protein [Granulosicoccus sp.]
MGSAFNNQIQQKLGTMLSGDLLTDAFSRGRYATDASIYQMMPQGVVIPKNWEDVIHTLAVASDAEIPVLPRGGGTSQCGQTVNQAIVLDNTRYLNQILELDVENQRCVVEPGIVLDELNRALKPHGLWFPVDVSTASRATIGGMTANNSCGSRSIRHGTMRDNVLSIDAIMADGSDRHFGHFRAGDTADPFIQSLLSLGEREQHEIADRFPNVMRRIGGYNIDALVVGDDAINLSHLLVGSEGTLAYSKAIELQLKPLPSHKLLGVCHFPSFYAAMDAAQHLVTLDPVAVELIDRTMIDLSRDIAIYRDTVNQFVRGEPEAILLVEFAEPDPEENARRLKGLGEMMASLGFAFDHPKEKCGGVVEAIDPAFQSAIFEVRKSGLNIMMSMREDRKPISFVEDCAVELKDLAEYTARLTDIFHKYDTEGTWYAHASVGCLHVRPVLNLRLDKDIQAMRGIAEECFDMVKQYKGSHSGEHGDGLCRSEFHEKMFGERMVNNFKEVKTLFDPNGLMNPGKIVDPPKMDDQTLFRFSPKYQVPEIQTALNWSGWTGAGGGFQGAVEMCNNNGACRKLSGGSMCPSYRVTRDEKDVTRGRANSLRLAISGQLGKDALTSDAMQEAMKLCVSCKSCKRECPTGVDMARMKIEVTAARYQKFGASLHDKLIANLPRYAPFAARLSWLFNLRNRSAWLAKILETSTGFSAGRKLPEWRRDIFKDPDHAATGNDAAKQVVLFADTFNRYFEPENVTAAKSVLSAAGYEVILVKPSNGGRPLCCGRTFLTAGMVDKAKKEVGRLLDSLGPYLERGVPVIGLEPSCTLAMRDEISVLVDDPRAKLLATQSKLFEEFLAEENPTLPLQPVNREARLHGHCHQKAHNVMPAVEQVLHRVPDLAVKTIESSCCGMAGSFGYAKDTVEISKQMAEADLLPAVRKTSEDTLIVADGTSCRHQIALGAERDAIHVARVLEMSLRGGQSK